MVAAFAVTRALAKADEASLLSFCWYTSVACSLVRTARVARLTGGGFLDSDCLCNTDVDSTPAAFVLSRMSTVGR